MAMRYGACEMGLEKVTVVSFQLETEAAIISSQQT